MKGFELSSTKQINNSIPQISRALKNVELKGVELSSTEQTNKSSPQISRA